MAEWRFNGETKGIDAVLEMNKVYAQKSVAVRKPTKTRIESMPRVEAIQLDEFVLDVLSQLDSKHGDDYSAMERDTGINTAQFSAAQLEEACSRRKVK
ncbi:MAG: uncharacterized protein A8A55_0292 [Amphiamblys sp. WSBS2006]|nr:MAG: uncharacterized protein A8A55_0292 [Amphiamblys sp. WSBS2006]